MSKRKINFQVLQPEDQSVPTHISLEDLLLEASRKTSVKAMVPECLIQTSPTTHHLISTEKGVVTVLHGSHAYNKFFELVDLALVRGRVREMAGQLPKYIVKSSSTSCHLCVTQEECIVALGQAIGKCSVIRLIQAKGPKPCIYRVNFSLGKGMTVYMVKNGRRNEAMRRFTELRTPGFQTKQITIYQHKATDFVYAGKLHKASFSPYLPHKSLLVPPSPNLPRSIGNSISLSPQNSPLSSPRPSICVPTMPKGTESSGKELDYVVDTSNMHQCKVFQVEDRLTALESRVTDLIESLERGNKRRNVAKISVDWVNSENDEWYLVDCTDIQWQDNQHQTEANLRAKLDNLSRISHNRHYPSSPSQLSASLSDRVLLKPPLSPRNHPYEPEEALAKSQLSSVQAKYDGIISQARKSKVLSRDLVAEIAAAHNSTKQLESVLERAWVCIGKELGSEKKDTAQAKEVLMEVLSGTFRNTLKATKVAMHHRLNFTPSQYSAFVQIVVQEALRIGLPEETLELLQERLTFFELQA